MNEYITEGTKWLCIHSENRYFIPGNTYAVMGMDITVFGMKQLRILDDDGDTNICTIPNIAIEGETKRILFIPIGLINEKRLFAYKMTGDISALKLHHAIRRYNHKMRDYIDEIHTAK